MSIVDIFVTISNLHYYEHSKDLKNLLHDISPFSLLWSHSKFFPLNHFLFDKWLEFSVWIFSPQIGTICHFPPLHLGTTYFGTQINGWICSETQKCKIIVWLLIIHISIHPDKGVSQGGRSCTKARRAFAEKFGLGQKFEALTYVILLRY